MTNGGLPNIHADSPIIDVHKVHFQFNAYAKTIAQIIANPDTKTPITIGIDGEWGSGKTTLMRLVDHYLSDNDETSKNARICKTIWFNAWKYEKEEALFTALITQILQKMKKDGFIKRFMAEYYDPTKPDFKISQMLVNLLYQTATLGQIDVDLTKFEEETKFKKSLPFLDEFQDLFDKLLVRYTNLKVSREEGVDDSIGALVIFIDDLDRCIPSKIVRMLEIIKLLLDRPGCFFVIGADIKILEAAVKAHYAEAKLSELRSSDYLDKIFQVRFTLPPIRVNQMNSFINLLPGLDPTLRENLELISSAIKNPRRIKTFINHIELQWSIFQNTGLAETMNKDLLIDWLVVNEISQELRFSIKSMADDTNQVLDLVKSLKDLSMLREEDWQEHIERRPHLKRFTSNRTLFKVLHKSRLNKLDEQNVGFYIHLSDIAPPLLNTSEQTSDFESITQTIEQEILSAYARKQNPSALEISSRGVNLSGKNLAEARFRNVDFSGANFSNSQFILADLSNAILVRSNLENANLQKADLRGGNLERAILHRAELWRADLTGANLKDCDCREAIFSEAILINVVFSGCDLENAQMESAQINLRESDVLQAKNWEKANWSEEHQKLLTSLSEDHSVAVS